MLSLESPGLENQALRTRLRDPHEPIDRNALSCQLFPEFVNIALFNYQFNCGSTMPIKAGNLPCINLTYLTQCFTKLSDRHSAQVTIVATANQDGVGEDLIAGNAASLLRLIDALNSSHQNILQPDSHPSQTRLVEKEAMLERLPHGMPKTADSRHYKRLCSRWVPLMVFQ